MKASQLYLFQEIASKNLCAHGSGEPDLFLTVCKGQLRSLRGLFHPRNSPSVPKPKIELKWKEVTEGRLLQPIWHGLLKHVTLDQQRNVLLQNVYRGKWKNATRVLCACCRKAFVVFTMQDSSSQPVVTASAGASGYFWRVCEMGPQQKSWLWKGYNLLQGCGPLHWNVLGTCSL